jgi:hypothetical protein
MIKKKYWKFTKYSHAAGYAYSTTSDLIQHNMPDREDQISQLQNRIEYLTDIVAFLLDTKKSVDADKLKALLSLHDLEEVSEEEYEKHRWS